jgi:hypothetical protein
MESEMANGNTKARNVQLIRTDDKIPGTVRFYDRRVEDAGKAFIGEVNIARMMDDRGQSLAIIPDCIVKAAIHGYTQNILDSSNKLDGDERVAFIRNACRIVQDGGWSSAPVDEEKARETAISAMMKLGFTREAAMAALASKG